MTMMVNPGSEVPADGVANCYAAALAEASRWHEAMRCPFPEVEMLDPPAESECSDGRWVFKFHHPTTGVTVELETHGITEQAAEVAGLIFGPPRIYWNGSSSGVPRPEDWIPRGETWSWTYRLAPAGSDIFECQSRQPNT